MMVFFMRCWKKSNFIFLVVLTTLIAAFASAGSNHAHIKSAEMQLRDDVWYLQADLDVQFGRALEEALSKGIELTFMYEFQIVKPQKYWFDDEVLTERKLVMLSYHALTKQYLLQRGAHQKTFENVNEARRDLAQVRDWELASRSVLEKGESYQAALKMHLDQSKLPKALQVDAWGESDWALVTPTFSWWIKDKGQ